MEDVKRHGARPPSQVDLPAPSVVTTLRRSVERLRAVALEEGPLTSCAIERYNLDGRRATAWVCADGTWSAADHGTEQSMVRGGVGVTTSGPTREGTPECEPPETPVSDSKTDGEWEGALYRGEVKEGAPPPVNPAEVLPGAHVLAALDSPRSVHGDVSSAGDVDGDDAPPGRCGIEPWWPGPLFCGGLVQPPDPPFAQTSQQPPDSGGPEAEAGIVIGPGAELLREMEKRVDIPTEEELSGRRQTTPETMGDFPTEEAALRAQPGNEDGILCEMIDGTFKWFPAAQRGDSPLWLAAAGEYKGFPQVVRFVARRDADGYDDGYGDGYGAKRRRLSKHSDGDPTAREEDEDEDEVRERVRTYERALAGPPPGPHPPDSTLPLLSRPAATQGEDSPRSTGALQGEEKEQATGIGSSSSPAWVPSQEQGPLSEDHHIFAEAQRSLIAEAQSPRGSGLAPGLRRLPSQPRQKRSCTGCQRRNCVTPDVCAALRVREITLFRLASTAKRKRDELRDAEQQYELASLLASRDEESESWDSAEEELRRIAQRSAAEGSATAKDPQRPRSPPVAGARSPPSTWSLQDKEEKLKALRLPAEKIKALTEDLRRIVHRDFGRTPKEPGTKASSLDGGTEEVD